MAHVLSRGNARATVFRSANEYVDFIGLLNEARQKYAVELFAFCVMPNHFHLVARFEDTRNLSAMMQWWLTSHVRRYHQRHVSTGHVWQGRYKSFPIQQDEHLLTVLRYVLQNPCRAGLTKGPFDWRWSSLRFKSMTAPWPISLATTLEDWLAAPGDAGVAAALSQSIKRGTPFGDPAWQVEAARSWGLEATLRPRGRPRLFDALEKQASLSLGC